MWSVTAPRRGQDSPTVADSPQPGHAGHPFPSLWTRGHHWPERTQAGWALDLAFQGGLCYVLLFVFLDVGTSQTPRLMPGTLCAVLMKCLARGDCPETRPASYYSQWMPLLSNVIPRRGTTRACLAAPPRLRALPWQDHTGGPGPGLARDTKQPQLV